MSAERPTIKQNILKAAVVASAGTAAFGISQGVAAGETRAFVPCEQVQTTIFECRKAEATVDTSGMYISAKDSKTGKRIISQPLPGNEFDGFNNGREIKAVTDATTGRKSVKEEVKPTDAPNW